MKTPLQRTDPSRTGSIRRAYEAEFVRRVTAVRNLAIKSMLNDALGLSRMRSNSAEPLDPFTFANLPMTDRIAKFMEWLTDVIDVRLLKGRDLSGPETDGGWQKTYVRRAYLNGTLKAVEAINRETPNTFEAAQFAAQRLVQSPFRRAQLEMLYSRNFAELKGMSQSMADNIQRILADALLAGRSPKVAAREIRDRAGVSLNRARAIARTEIVSINAEAILSTFEQTGLKEVVADVEFLTAGDSRVCSRCAALSGKVFTIEQARGVIAVHTACRCSWLPLVAERRDSKAA